MEEEILKLKKAIKSNTKFSIVCISFIEIMLIVLPLLFNKAMPNVTGNVDNLFFIKNYFLKFFPFLSVGLNSYSIKLLFDNKKLNKEVVNLEVLDEKQKIEEEMKQEVKKSMMYEETREVNDDLEFLKYLYKTDTDLYIMLLQDNYLESALKEKGYDDVTIKDFVNYVKNDINGVKPLVRVK
ncbi:MAG: hypothetical protein MR297_04220 [Tenericutes bacterium]|nr:hypothetical protein [Mycoplasmatota bacterium]